MQEELRHDEWKLLVACITLNLATAKVARTVIWRLFERWPTASSVSESDEREIAELLRPLGLQRRRARSVVALSKRLASGPWRGDVADLPGCGKYASDSHEIFVRGNIVEDVTDKKLRMYVDWATRR